MRSYQTLIDGHGGIAHRSIIRIVGGIDEVFIAQILSLVGYPLSHHFTSFHCTRAL